MKVIQFKIILLGFTLLQGIEVSAKQSTKMITYDGLAKYADRFEFLPSDDCKSFEMRSWGRVLDKENNTLSKNDLCPNLFYKLGFSLKSVGCFFPHFESF